MGNTGAAHDDKARASGGIGHILPAELRTQYWDGALAIFLLFLMQIIIYALSFLSIFLQGFSAAIMGMVFLALVIGLVDWAGRRFRGSDAVEVFYQRFLRGPTDLLNKHMSLGFTVPFIQIFRSKPASSLEIGLITSMFVLMGVVSPILVYYLAYAIHSCSLRLRTRGKNKSSGFEETRTDSCGGQLSIALRQPVKLRNNGSSLTPYLLSNSTVAWQKTPRSRGFSDQATLMGCCSIPNPNPGLNRPTTEPEAEGNFNLGGQSQSTLVKEKPKERQKGLVDQKLGAWKIVNWILHNICMVLCVLSIPISIGLGASTGITVFADTSVLFGIWMTTLTLQVMARNSPSLKNMPRRRTALVVGLNPVLMTSGVMIGYIQAKRALLGSSVLTVLDTFQSGLTFASFLMARTTHGAAFSHMTAANMPLSVLTTSRNRTGHVTDGAARLQQPCMGAGDVALTVLESGLVAWGLKLFEYRRALVSHAGLVVMVASTMAATITVVAGPLLAHAVGLARAQSISFAARGVTLALGTPVMIKLGGDIGENAAMVVLNGIIFQTAMGLGIVGWIVHKVEWCLHWAAANIKTPWSDKTAQLDLELADDSSELTPTSRDWLAPSPGGEGNESFAGSGNGNISSALPPSTSPRQQHQASPYIISSDACLDEECQCRQQTHIQLSDPSSSSAAMLLTAAGTTHAALSPNVIKELPPPSLSSEPQPPSPVQASSSTTIKISSSGAMDRGAEGARAVAMGVTVGVNAAAMGTSYLYEQGSWAAPYSALAMTIFGVMTVVLTAINPLTEWLGAQLGPAVATS